MDMAKMQIGGAMFNAPPIRVKPAGPRILRKEFFNRKTREDFQSKRLDVAHVWQ
jgi:hypothetical protein